MLRDDHVGTFESETSDLKFSIYDNDKGQVQIWVTIGVVSCQVPVEQIDEIIEMFQTIQEYLKDE